MENIGSCTGVASVTRICGCLEEDEDREGSGGFSSMAERALVGVVGTSRWLTEGVLPLLLLPPPPPPLDEALPLLKERVLLKMALTLIAAEAPAEELPLIFFVWMRQEMRRCISSYRSLFVLRRRRVSMHSFFISRCFERSSNVEI